MNKIILTGVISKDFEQNSCKKTWKHKTSRTNV